MIPGKVMLISVHGDPLTKLGGIQSGGQNVYVKELALALDSLGIPVDVISHWSDNESSQIERFGFNSRVIRLAAGHKGFIPKNRMFKILPDLFNELRDFIKDYQEYSVIHSNYWLSGWVGLQLQKKKNIPRVHTSHSLGFIRKKAITAKQEEQNVLRIRTEKEVLLLADRVIATTPEEKDILNLKYGVPLELIDIIPCGVNIELFQNPLKHNIQIKHLNKQKNVLFVGRFEENKGLIVLLDAFSILKNRYSSSELKPRLLIVGGDDLEKSSLNMSAEKKKYIKLIEDKGLKELVDFMGPLEHEELAAYYNSAVMTVVPSYYESFGLVAVEAMAAGCPVIASRTGGLKHNIKHGVTGLLVQPKDPAALAEAIDYILQNENEQKKMAANAALYAGRFSWKGIAGVLLNTYEEVSVWQKFRKIIKA